MGKPRVLLADDDSALMEILARRLSPVLSIVAKVSDGQALIDAAEKLNPDLIITDISMPILNGIQAVARLKESGCQAKVVFLTVRSDPDFIRDCLSTDAQACVLKTRIPIDLLAAVQDALAGRVFVSPNHHKLDAAHPIPPVANSLIPRSVR